MKKTNVHDLLSEAIEDGLGNTSSQKQNVSALFIDGLFSEDGITIEHVDRESGMEYHVMFDGYKSIGATPAAAIKNLIQGIIDYFQDCHF